jgi:hypothetical protein
MPCITRKNSQHGHAAPVSGSQLRLLIRKEGMTNQVMSATGNITPQDLSASIFASAQLEANIREYPKEFFSRVQHLLMQKLK